MSNRTENISGGVNSAVNIAAKTAKGFIEQLTAQKSAEVLGKVTKHFVDCGVRRSLQDPPDADVLFKETESG